MAEFIARARTTGTEALIQDSLGFSKTLFTQEAISTCPYSLDIAICWHVSKLVK